MAKVLIVDDETSLREIFSEILTDAGHEVICACNGKEGVKLYQENVDIDLVILDVVMPEMGGELAFEKMKMYDDNRGKETNVIIASGYPDERVVQALIDNGVKNFYTKNRDFILKLPEIVKAYT